MPAPQNELYYGDNLDVLDHHIKDETVDLVYLDPPFKSTADYNVIFEEQDGTRAASQIQAFEDTWRWDNAAALSFQKAVEAGGPIAEALLAFEKLVPRSDMLAYLSMMAPRLEHLRRVLKPAGSLYLHCDTAASHYLKLLLDAVFGPENFRSEIIWRRTGSNSAKKRYGPIHQTIFFYVKSKAAPFYPQPAPYTKGYVHDYFTQEDDRGRYRPVLLTGPGVRTGDSGKPWRHYDPTTSGRHWQPSSYVYDKYRALTGQDLADVPLLERLDRLDEVKLIHWDKKGKGVPNYKYYLADAPGVYYQDIWAYQPGTDGAVYGRPDDEGIDQDVKWLTTMDRERLGYQTQKPEGVLERIVKSSSKEGDLVLDPFCGCGTTIAVAHQLNRRWVGIDVTQAAMVVIKERLKTRLHLTEGTDYRVTGEPVSIPDAVALAKDDAYQFQWWALGLVGARPTPEKQKKGPDAGIDGRLYFHDEAGGKTKQIVFSVKAGKVTVDHVRTLAHVVKREKAQIGALISLLPPTPDMKKEAAGEGFYTWMDLSTKKDRHFPRIQLRTIEQLLEGKGIEYPPATHLTFKAAPSAKQKHGMEPLPLE